MKMKFYAIVSAIVLTAGLQGQDLTQQLQALNNSLQQPQVAAFMNATQADQAALQNLGSQAYDLVTKFQSLSQDDVKARVEAIINGLPQNVAGVQVPQALVQFARQLANELLFLVPVIQQTDFNALANNYVTPAITLGRSFINNPQELLGAITLVYTIIASQLPQSIRNVIVANPNIAGDAGVLDTLKKIVESKNPVDAQAITALQILANAASDVLAKVYANRNNLNAINFANEFATLQNIVMQNFGTLMTFGLMYTNNAVNIYEKAKLIRAEDVLNLVRTVRSMLEARGLIPAQR